MLCFGSLAGNGWGLVLPEDKRESVREEIMDEWSHRNCHGGKGRHGHEHVVSIARGHRSEQGGSLRDSGQLTRRYPAMRQRNQRGRTLEAGNPHRVLLQHYRLVMITNKVQPEIRRRE